MRLTGPSGFLWPTLSPAAAPRAGCPGPRPGGCWRSPGRRLHNSGLSDFVWIEACESPLFVERWITRDFRESVVLQNLTLAKQNKTYICSQSNNLHVCSLILIPPFYFSRQKAVIFSKEKADFWGNNKHNGGCKNHKLKIQVCTEDIKADEKKHCELSI